MPPLTFAGGTSVVVVATTTTTPPTATAAVVVAARPRAVLDGAVVVGDDGRRRGDGRRGRGGAGAGPRAEARGAHEVQVRDPLTGQPTATLTLDGDAVATSGIDHRLWLHATGCPAHHLLNPTTNRPAWTGVPSATAKAPTAERAEALAKAAVLSGPTGGRAVLAAHGGVLTGYDGVVHEIAAGDGVAGLAREIVGAAR